MAKIAALDNNKIFEESDKLLKEIPFSKISVKLKAILALKNHSITKVCDVFSISRNTIKIWVKNFDLYGIDGLLPKERKSRKSKLSRNQKEEIRLWIEDNPNLTLKELKLKIGREFKVTISQMGIWKNLKKMNLSYITARPKHYMQDKVKLDEFKKNSTKNNKE